jgi:hypothetical protein
VAELAASFSGKAPPITGELLDDAAGGSPLFDCSKAKTQLGLEARGGREVVRATAEWARQMGWVPPRA